MKDLNRLAKHITDIATGQTDKPKAKNPAAVALGREGGLKGGKARTEKMTSDERKKAATKAANVRWGKNSVGN